MFSLNCVLKILCQVMLWTPCIGLVNLSFTSPFIPWTCKIAFHKSTYVQFELCAQNIVSGDVVDTLYRCVHNVYVAHQAGMPRQQDAHGISRVSTIEGVMYIFVLGKFKSSFFLPKWLTKGQIISKCLF